MTALDQYVRLEAEAIWYETADSDPRSVIVSFGNESLIISSFDDAPLAHWSLAATRITGKSGDEIIYSPGSDALEKLHVSDEIMVEAIREVTASVIKRRQPRRRSHLKIWLILFVGAIAAAIIWLPSIVRTKTAELISTEQAVLLSDRILSQSNLRFCRDNDGLEALDIVRNMVLMPSGGDIQLAVLPLERFVQLPDGRVLLDQSMLQNAQSADEFAGWLALAASLPKDEQALGDFIATAPLGDVVRYALTGEVTPVQIDQMTQFSLSQAVVPDPASVENALGLLRSAGIEQRPFRDGLNLPLKDEVGPFRLVLDRGEWAALRTICGP